MPSEHTQQYRQSHLRADIFRATVSAAGFNTLDAEAFTSMWARRITTELANRDVRVYTRMRSTHHTRKKKYLLLGLEDRKQLSALG